MSNIEELHQRIIAALARVESGLNHLDPSGAKQDQEDAARGDPEEILQLEVALAAEKNRNSRLAEQMEMLDLQVQNLRYSNEELRRSNTDLRTALVEGLGDKDLIHTSMAREMEALRADRAVETAQTTAILETLAPLLQEVEGAA